MFCYNYTHVSTAIAVRPTATVSDILQNIYSYLGTKLVRQLITNSSTHLYSSNKARLPYTLDRC